MAEQESRLENKSNEWNPPPRKPIIIRAIRAFKHQYHRYAAESEKRKSDHGENERTMVRWTRQVGIFTIVLSLIAALSASISYLQWREMQSQLQEIRASGEDTKRLIDAATKSAMAAEDTVALNRENAQRHLRAYLTVEDVTARLDGETFNISIRFRNSGQTPAYEVDADSWLLRANPNTPIMKLYSEKSPNPFTVGSRMAISKGSYMSVSPQELAIFRNPDAIVAIHGEVTYRDVFNIAHVTKYRFRRERIFGDVMVFVVARDGNEAD